MERSMILYLSGPITGVDNYQEIFRTARGRLAAMGYKVINPAEMIGGCYTRAPVMRTSWT